MALINSTSCSPCLLLQSHLGPLSSSPSILPSLDYSHTSTLIISDFSNEFSSLAVPTFHFPLTPQATTCGFISHQSTVAPLSKVIFINAESHGSRWVPLSWNSLLPNIVSTMLLSLSFLTSALFLGLVNFSSSVYCFNIGLVQSSVFSPLIFPLCTLP